MTRSSMLGAVAAKCWIFSPSRRQVLWRRPRQIDGRAWQRKRPANGPGRRDLVPSGAAGRVDRAVFSAQVIEHLEYEDLVRFHDEAYRALQPGGVFIAETVNPHSIQAFKSFWTDLTHRVPIFPEVAVMLCLVAGFSEATVLFPNGTGDLETDRCPKASTPSSPASSGTALEALPL